MLVGAFVLVFGATTVAFAQAASGHLAAIHAPNADVTVVDYEVTDDGLLDVTLRVHNPTVRAIAVPVAQMNAYVDGEQVSDGTTTRLDGVAVGSGATRNVTVPLDLREGGAERLASADAGQVSVEGQLKGKVGSETVYVSLDGAEGGE